MCRQNNAKVSDGVYCTRTFGLYNEVMFYLYVLVNEEGALYFGSTNDLKRRLHEHQTGQSRATKGHKWSIRYYEAYRDESDARERERKIKLDGRVKAGLRRLLGISRRTECSSWG